MAEPLPSYLRTFRRRWALTQCELAELLGGVSAGAISKYETLARMPSLEVMLKLEIVFDQASHALFPSLVFEMRRVVRFNAIALKDRLVVRNDARAVRKCELLDDLINRLTQSYEETH